MKTMLKTGIAIFYIVIHAYAGLSQKAFTQLTRAEKKLYKEHIAGGQPDTSALVYVRQGYVLQYNQKYRIPNWVSYHVKPDYLKAPKREKRFKSFRTDPDVPNPVKNQDYTGSEYARGHMAPYFAMGGDRDKNGVYSNAQDESEDPYDDQTVLEANYMTNISPQDQNALNGPGGPWYALETAIRTKLVGKNKMELNVITGSIVLDTTDLHFLKNKNTVTDIVVPDGFYQVIIYKDKNTGEYITGAFLFPHVKKHQDLPFDDLIGYIVSVDSIEVVTKLNFLNELSKEEQDKTESKPNKEFWEAKMN